jgi:hypothetical protein
MLIVHGQSSATTPIIGVLVFPGNGIQENLADKAKKLGIPFLKVEKGASAPSTSLSALCCLRRPRVNNVLCSKTCRSRSTDTAMSSNARFNTAQNLAVLNPIIKTQ